MFSLSLKMSKSRLETVRNLDQKLSDYVTPLKHKDSISRLTEALGRYKEFRDRTEEDDDVMVSGRVSIALKG